MGDYSADAANPTTMRLTIGDLNKKRNVDAADGDGLSCVMTVATMVFI